GPTRCALSTPRPASLPRSRRGRPMTPRVRSVLLRTLVAAAVASLSVAPTFAQSIVDARRAEFSPSTDDSATEPDGTPIVQNYILQIFLAGGSTPVQSVDLGKPAPDPDGFIRVDFVALLPTPLATGVVYEARVGANGPGGLSLSDVSNTFSYSSPCTPPTISPASQSVVAGGGTGSTTVTAGAGCAWTAVSNATWITITTGAAGTGNGSVTFSVAANTAGTSRTGTLTVVGNTFTVTQAGVPCTSTLSPATQAGAVGGGSGTVGGTAPAGCS